MTTTLITQPERAELYRELAAWIAPSVPAIRARLESLGQGRLLENNLGLFLVAQVAAMEQMVTRAGRADEARSRGFLATWDSLTSRTPGSRWFPAANLNINVRRASPAKVGGLSPDVKSAIDYLVAGVGQMVGAAINNRPDIEVLDGSGKVVSRTRKRGGS
jgi:hypothetical protein